MKKVISYCLYGNNPRYYAGAVMNVIEANRLYPGWVCRIYTDLRNEIITTLKYLKAEVVVNPKPLNAKSLWRFLAVDDSDICLIRDIDSIVNERDRACVDDWLSSGAQWHIMRDHPAHKKVPMMAGMWGYRKSPTVNDRKIINFEEKSIADYMTSWAKATRSNLGLLWSDQKFLQHLYETHIKFSSIHRHGRQGLDFPKHERMRYSAHVGSRDFRDTGYWLAWQDQEQNSKN